MWTQIGNRSVKCAVWLEDPKTWFRICDVDGDRRLSRDEVISALKAQLPLATWNAGKVSVYVFFGAHILIYPTRADCICSKA